tara:strand:+ start:818 stop:1393 length:576 start_codon:yes stop_codon:yes gene_type:complete
MKKSKYEIVDNALPNNVFQGMQDYIMSNNFPWFFQDSIAYAPEIETNEGYPESKKNKDLVANPLTSEQKHWNSYMTHKCYDSNFLLSTPNVWVTLEPIIKLLKAKALIRIKCNMYPKTPKIIHHKDHIDFSYAHKGALFYMNTNNGLTVLEDGTKIKSVANRLLLFDSSKPHHSTTTSNENRRVNINFNYL